MRAAACAAGLAAVALAACGGGGGDEAEKGERTQTSTAPERSPQISVLPKAGEPQEAGPIRSWSAAVNRGRYREAAAFFAPDAVIEQGREFRLPGRAAAIAFNKGLPCRADVTDVDDEGDTVLAAFRLRDGPGGDCDGSARVRFRFRGQRFREWRQLAEPQTPPGAVA